MPWEFKALTRKVELRPGEMGEATFYVRNKSNDRIVGQAVPIVVPAWAGEYLNKVECFCFQHQPLAPGEEREMPVRFVVSAELPKEVNAMTLAYTFMNTDHESSGKYGGVVTH
jgi:cytochrome c oxidase assembly protein subunit 11